MVLTTLGRVDRRPLPGPVLAGLVQDLVDHRLPGLGVALAQRRGGDLDQAALQIAAVPFVEDVDHLVSAEAGGADHRVGLADELHVAVLDAVASSSRSGRRRQGR